MSGISNNALSDTPNYSQLYNRKDWIHWIDIDGDCQNTRAEILIKFSKTPPIFSSKSHCAVKEGYWLDAYSGKVLTAANEIDIDHLVPLAWANGHGGDQWDANQKMKFANDFENLTVTSRKLNRIKGNKGLDEWLPPNINYRCQYISRFISVVKKYKLELIPAESEQARNLNALCKKGKIKRLF